MTLHPSKLPLVYWFLSSAMLQCQKMRNLSISQQLTFTNGIFSQSYPQSTIHRGTSPKQRLRSIQTTCPPNSLTPSSSPPCSSSHSTELTACSSFLQNHISSHYRASLEARHYTASTPIHILHTFSPASVFPLSTSVPLTALGIPCKMPHQKSRLHLPKVRKPSSGCITLRRAALPGTNYFASWVCGMHHSTFFINCWSKCNLNYRKNPSMQNY